MDLSTKYLGLELAHPLMPGASPLTGDLDEVKRLEDGGAAAIVMNSLFEEQIVAEEMATHDAMETPAESFAEALSYFPKRDEFRLGPAEYLEQIRKISERQEISPRYLELIFQRLKHAGILKTQRGAKGGYYLSRHPSEITVADVVRHTDGPLSLVNCWEHGQKNVPCHRAPCCVMKPVWQEASRQLEEYLDSVTFADLCRSAGG